MKKFLFFLLGVVAVTSSIAKDVYNSSSDTKTSHGASQSLSVNSLILSSYVNIFEEPGGLKNICGLEGKADGRLNLDFVQKFGGMKLVSNPKLNFPVFVSAAALLDRNSRGKESVREYLEHWKKPPSGHAYLSFYEWMKVLQDTGSRGVTGWSGQYLSRNSLMGMGEENVRNYVYSFVIANHFTKYAAIAVGGKNFKNEQVLNSEINAAFCGELRKVPSNPEIEAAIEKANYSTCTSVYYSPGVEENDMKVQCGSIDIDANARTFKFNGVPTLSESSIGGYNVTVTVGNDSSKTKSTSEKIKSR